MNTRQSTRTYRTSALHNVSVEDHLSDTEEMDDEEEEEDLDSQDLIVFSQPHRRRQLHRIQDTEELLRDDVEVDAETTDVSEEEEEERGGGGRVAQSNERTQPRYHRIYLPDAEELPTDDDGDGDNEEEEEAADDDDESTSVSSEEGRISTRSDTPLFRRRMQIPNFEEDSESVEGRVSPDHDWPVLRRRMQIPNYEEDSESVEGRVSPDHDEPVRRHRIQMPNSEEDSDSVEGRVSSDHEWRFDESDADVAVISNVEEVLRDFGQGDNQSYPELGNSNINGFIISNSSSTVNVQEQVLARVQLGSNGSSIAQTGDGLQGPSTSKTVEKTGESAATAVASLSHGDKEDEGQTCPICFVEWSNVGSHRIVSLKCGHLFGKECIERWLNGQGSKCPQCKAKAHKRDIRIIYARSLKAEDTSEKVWMTREIEKLKRERALDEREKAQQKMRIALDSQLIKKLQGELKMLKESVKNNSSHRSMRMESGSSSAKRYKLSLFQSFDLANKNGTCRVMAFNEWLSMLVVSVKNHLEMFPGFGIKKINTLDFKVENYIHLHSKQVRDLAFNPVKRDFLLSVGMDKVAKVTNVSSNATVVSYDTNCALWSCCWNSDKDCEFFVGTATGLIYHFDAVRNVNEALNTYQVSGSGPVVSLSYVPLDQKKDFYFSGLIVTRLTSISFVEILENGIEDHDLPIEGSFSYTAFDPVSRHFLATCRPSDRNFHARHILCELSAINMSEDPMTIKNVISAHQVHCFQGSTTMKALSRACLASCQISDDGNWVAIYNEESTSSIKVYDIRTSSLIQTIKSVANVIDILPVKGSRNSYVAMLSDRCVKLYQWIEQL